MSQDYGVYSKRPASPSSKTAPKRKRIEGGRAAQAKKVTADLDSEDEIIVQMKQKNFSDRDVAQKLVSEGRINYDRKTIATRWARLRKALSEREDQLLDDELTDWHEGEVRKCIVLLTSCLRLLSSDTLYVGRSPCQIFSPCRASS